MEKSYTIGPVDQDHVGDVSNVGRNEKSSIWCGQLQYISDSNGFFHMRGIANGRLIVNFSENGIIIGRISQQTVTGANYNYDTKNYRYQLGFTCL